MTTIPTIITITNKLGFNQIVELHAKKVEYIPHYEHTLQKRSFDDDRKMLGHVEIKIEC